uniref:Putative secreted protein n=1 Tax=Anopheles darlingi TaxID=43151 RepID=A0A2M4D4W3_ANODA
MKQPLTDVLVYLLLIIGSKCVLSTILQPQKSTLSKTTVLYFASNSRFYKKSNFSCLLNIGRRVLRVLSLSLSLLSIYSPQPFVSSSQDIFSVSSFLFVFTRSARSSLLLSSFRYHVYHKRYPII